MKYKLLMIVVALCCFSTVFAQSELVGEVVIRGNEVIDEAVIKNLVRTREGQPFQQSQLARDKQSIESLGVFQDVKVYGLFVSETRTWRVVIEVVEWPVVNEIRIVGNTVISTDLILDVLKQKKGSIFNESYLQDDALAIAELYFKNGYFARVSKYEPLESDISVIEIVIAETTIRNIEFNGLFKTKRSILDKLMDLKPGALFEQSKYDEDVRRLWETRWFERIDPEPHEPELGKLDINFNVEEARTALFNVGFSVDPRNRLVGFASYTDSNYQGTGKSIGVNLSQSAQGLGTGISLDYGDPFIDDRRTGLEVSLYSRNSFNFGSSFFGGGDGLDDSAKFARRRTGVTSTLTRPVQRFTRAFVGLRLENVSSQNFAPDPGEEFLVQDGSTIVATFGATRNRRDNPMDPAHGDWARIAFEPSYVFIKGNSGLNPNDPTLGNHLYVKNTFEYRLYYSPQPKRTPANFNDPRRVFAGRLTFGTILGSEVPFFEQFFIGGTYGVRGYEEDRFWGRHSAMLQLEYRHPIQREFSVIGFVDYGGAWGGYPGVKNFDQTKNPKFHLGFGAGIAFKTPLGPIRIDLGFNERGRGRAHFQIGGSF